jgi:hypothetical protein
MTRNYFAALMMPLGSYASTYSFVTAAYGFGMVSMVGGNTTAEAVTFVFERGGAVGINAFMLDASGIRSAENGKRIIPFAHKAIVDAFMNLTALLQRPMEVPAPYKWILGMEGTKGRHLVHRFHETDLLRGDSI